MSDSPKTTPNFVHLHVHSHYSLLNALPTPKELASAAKADGQTMLAITDNGALYGAIDFYKACTKEGIKPIIGLDAHLAPRTRHDKDAQIDKPRARLVLLAKTFAGYQNLIKLVTLSNLEGFYYKPRLDDELIEKYAKDLVCIIPSFAGEVARALKDDDQEYALKKLDWYKKVFGADCYLEITHHPEILDHQSNQKKIIALAKETNTPLVAAHDVYYLKPEDRVARETLIKIQNGGVVDLSNDHGNEEDFSFITQAQAMEYFKDTPEALANTVKIAEECNVEIEIGTHWYFPDYQIESGKTPDDELQFTAYEGVGWRKLDINDPVVKTRLDYELDIIKTKGYAKYFLVVGDLLREARERGILTTIRGSVAGSLTTYVLGITNVDPIEYKLPFERFLNPERPSAPDIDMDFADNRRDEIIEYAKEKYGADKVAQIGTFGTMMARAAVRDVARALGHPYSVGDRIAKLIPVGSQGFPMTITKALEIEPDLASLYKKDSEAREVIDLAKQIEGRVRHLGVHAAGVVIAPEPLNQFVPIQADPKTGKFITQYEMKSVGEDGVGLLKFDFLGIKNLAILADAVKRVKKIREVEVDIENIPLDDSKTFAILAHGETMGLFQLNGTGMTAFLKQLKPSTIHDINAMVALYRPGPMESIPEYIERKHDASLISYLDPRLKPILDMSYGVITYQDDVMTIARELAGYSWLEADMLRKAMGKKIPEVMAAEKDKLLTGFVEYGKLTPALANKLWHLIEPFAAYGFNKCLPASTRVLDATTGIPTTIQSLLNRKAGPQVLALSDESKLIAAKASRPFKNGVKQVYKLTTRSGRIIRATGNHPLRVFAGWKNLNDCKVGERLAVPRHLPAPTSNSKLKSHEAAALGYLIAEGNFCHPYGVYFYSSAPDEIKDFSQQAKQFANTKLTVDNSKAATSVYVGKDNRAKPNALFNWVTKLGLIGKTATYKFIPDCIFAADDKTLAIFLGKLWQGDGAINIKNYQAFYATSSRRLADDVQWLLLRLGIISTIHTKFFNYRGGQKIGWTVVVSGQNNIAAFSKHLGKHLLSKKRAALQSLLEVCLKRSTKLGRGTTDTLPPEILLQIKTTIHKNNLSLKNLATMAGIAPRLLFGDQRRRGYTREIIAKIGYALKDQSIINHATSDIFWDEIMSIEPDGREMTYDLSVPGPNNFIADNFFVHNSHAASYGRVAYQTAYMKANFSVEYMSAVLTADSGDTEKISEIIRECERMNIEVLPPDINESFADFSVVPLHSKNSNSTLNSNLAQGMQGAGEYRSESYQAYGEQGTEPATQQTAEPNLKNGRIRFGLTTIKNFGEGIAEAIITERKKNGPFTSLSEFLSRVHDRNLNKKSLEALIMTGALDNFGERGQMLANIETLLTFNKEQVAEKESAQESLFGLGGGVANTLNLEAAPAATKIQKLIWEKELLGVYVSGHPLDEFADELAKRPSISEIKKVVEDKEEIAIVRLKGELVTAGMVSSVRELLTKKGDRMAFIALSDTKSDIEMVAFPETYLALKDVLLVGNCVAIKGKLSIRNDAPSILIDKAKLLSSKVETTKEAASQE